MVSMRMRVVIGLLARLLFVLLICSGLTLVILIRIAAFPHICIDCCGPEAQSQCENHVFHLPFSIAVRERAAKRNDRAEPQLRNTSCTRSLILPTRFMPSA